VIVEVWQKPPGSWFWDLSASIFTDDSGRIDFDVPFPITDI
jgi:hypothetical protein